MTQIEIKPLIVESSTSESTTVEVVLNGIRDGDIRIPDYQRDSDQWDETIKSLLVESVINNLSIPAFFFEVRFENGVERNEVIDGQQRLTTLARYFKGDFPLVASDDAPYLSPNSTHYAGKKFEELPNVYKQAFKKYRLAIIKLRNLEGDMRLEIFRRINQGGTPLSGQDIRLAYYGEKSPIITLVRLVGIYDPERDASKRFLERAAGLGVANPWRDQDAAEVWKDWWENRPISRGQTASEAFLWSLMAAQIERVNQLMENKDTHKTINVVFNGDIEGTLNTYCAMVVYQENHPEVPPILMTLAEMTEKFFPYFESWIKILVGVKGSTLPVTKHRTVAAIIGAAYSKNIDLKKLSDQEWTDVVEFVRRPAEMAKLVGCEWPLSKGRWSGAK